MSARYKNAHPCVTPSKRRYYSYEEAQADYERQRLEPTLAHVKLADWAYRCNCGQWHRTNRHDRVNGAVPL